MLKKNLMTAVAIIACGLSYSVCAAEQNASALPQNSIVKEDMTPPSAEGPLAANQMKPLLLADKAKPQDLNATTQQQVPSTASAPTS